MFAARIKFIVLCYRYLYYSDWSNRARIVRTNLDGSQPNELRAGLDNPNGLAIVGSGATKRLYVTDSHYKTRENTKYPGVGRNGSIYSMDLVGKNWRDELSQTPGREKLVVRLVVSLCKIIK